MKPDGLTYIIEYIVDGWGGHGGLNPALYEATLPPPPPALPGTHFINPRPDSLQPDSSSR